ncbi:MAG: radical SAM protein [Anaerolineales bacterium]
MYLSNYRGVAKLLRRNPRWILVAYDNLSHQLHHRISANSLNGRSHPPEVINAFVTDICNLGCRECHYANSDKPGFSLNQVGHMEPKTFYKFIDEIPGRPLVSFTGGEPLIHPQIFDLIRYAKNKGRMCTLVTNGWFLEEKAEQVCDSDLDLLSISVDGPRETHNAIRGSNSFERLEKGLHKILEQPKRPTLFISLTISDMNYDQLVPTYQLAKKWGVDGINFNHLWMQTDEMVERLDTITTLFTGDHVGWPVNNNDIDVEILADGLEIIRDISWGGKIIVTELPLLNRQEISDWYRKPEKPIKHRTVRCGWIRMKLWADGKIKPCRDWEVGDINKQHALEIWNGQEYQQFRQLLNEQGMLPICSRCCFIAHR